LYRYWKESLLLKKKKIMMPLHRHCKM
jgi:hypothetical protein